MGEKICGEHSKQQMGPVARKPDFVVCKQQRHRPACVSAQSDQHLYHLYFGKYNSLIILHIKFQYCYLVGHPKTSYFATKPIQ